MTAVIDAIKARSKSLSGADFLHAIFAEHYKEVIHNRRPVILFGAGSAGKELAECLMLHEVIPSYFCDTNADRLGKTVAGVPVISYREVRDKHKEMVIVVATNNFKRELKALLQQDGFAYWCCLDDSAQFFYYLQIYKWHHSLSELNHARLQQAYELLADDASRDLFIQRIALLTSYADYSLFKRFISEHAYEVLRPVGDEFAVSQFTANYESYYYFNNDVLTLEDDEVLVDGGAFDGDSTIEFIKACERHRLNYQHIFCVEADAANFSKLKVNTKAYENLSCIQAGLWSTKTQLYFANSDNMFITEARVIDAAIQMARSVKIESNDVVNTIRIDDLPQDERITFIKMDIEGSECEALEGARETLQRHKPKLAISIYHKKNDLYDIPLLIRDICPSYKFYLRHFSSHLGETVLLAHV